MKTSLCLLSCFLLAARVSAQCSLCPGGSTSITDSNLALVPNSILDATCGEVEADVAAAPNAECNAIVAARNIEIDYSAFCCSDVQSSNSCPFCAGVNIDANEAVPSDLSNFITTCGEAASFATYITGTALCATVLNVGSESCCIPATPSPTRSPTTGSPTRAPTGPPPTNAPFVSPTPAPISPLSAANSLSVSALTILGLFVWLVQA